MAAGTLSLGSAATLMEVSYRQAKRLYRRYRAEGAKGLTHRNAGRASNRAADPEQRARALALIRQKYSGDAARRFGPTLAAEHLASEDGLTVDHETLRRWMLAAGLWSRARKRSPHRRRRERGLPHDTLQLAHVAGPGIAAQQVHGSGSHAADVLAQIAIGGRNPAPSSVLYLLMINDSPPRRVVITGLGTLNPLGNDVVSTWSAVCAGRSGIGPITLFDAAGYESRIAGEVKGFDPVARFGRKDARRMARLTQLALAAAEEALVDAGLRNTSIARDRAGVIVGSGMGALDPIHEAVETLTGKGPGRVSPFFVPMMLADTPAAVISIAYGLTGPNLAVYSACATGNNALGEAAAAIRRGAADIMIAGGTEACILPLATSITENRRRRNLSQVR